MIRYDPAILTRTRTDFCWRGSFLTREDSILKYCDASSPWIAGGAVRSFFDGSEIKDYDVFFSSQSKMDCFLNKSLFEGWQREDRAMNVTLTSPQGEIVQCIKLFYSDMESLLDRFDFTICQFGYDGKEICCGDTSLYDLGKKRLVLHRVTYGVSTVRRMIKYSKKGFYACAGTITALLQACSVSPSLINEKVISVD